MKKLITVKPHLVYRNGQVIARRASTKVKNQLSLPTVKKIQSPRKPRFI